MLVTIKKRIPVIILLLTILITDLSGQMAVNEIDSATINQLLYNGRFKREEFYNVTGSEYMVEEGWVKGKVTINSHSFTNVNINYDLVSDVVIAPYLKRGNIILNPDLLSAFSFNHNGKNLEFVKILSEKKSISGYAELIYDGDIKLYKKRRKTKVYYDVTNSYGFRSIENLYLLNNEGFHRLKKRGDLLNLYKEDKTEIKNFIQQNRIGFNVENPYKLIPVLQLIDNLKVENEN